MATRVSIIENLILEKDYQNPVLLEHVTKIQKKTREAQYLIIRRLRNAVLKKLKGREYRQADPEYFREKWRGYYYQNHDQLKKRMRERNGQRHHKLKNDPEYRAKRLEYSKQRREAVAYIDQQGNPITYGQHYRILTKNRKLIEKYQSIIFVCIVLKCAV